MQKFIHDIYDEFNEELQMFGYAPECCDDSIRNSYVYAWYTKTNPKKYFYVGKGKRDRYKHILKEISDVENNPRKYKGKAYKILKDNLGIDCEFLYESLTDKESTILEAYTLLKFYKEKQPLLNVIIPCLDEELEAYRQSYFYEKDTEKFLSYYTLRCEKND